MELFVGVRQMEVKASRSLETIPQLAYHGRSAVQGSQTISTLRPGCQYLGRGSNQAVRSRKRLAAGRPQPHFTRVVFEGLHVAVAGRCERDQGRVDPCRDDTIRTHEIAHCGRAGKTTRGIAAQAGVELLPAGNRLQVRNVPNPLAVVSSSTISCSPSFARKEMATCISLSGRASTRD